MGLGLAIWRLVDGHSLGPGRLSGVWAWGPAAGVGLPGERRELQHRAALGRERGPRLRRYCAWARGGAEGRSRRCSARLWPCSEQELGAGGTGLALGEAGS